LVGAVASAAPIATAAGNPFERGPAPTETSVTAPQGPFATAKVVVPAGRVRGFGGGTIYYPTDTSSGTFGAIAVIPGFFGPQSSISWYGDRIASQGFVVFTLDASGLLDSPSERGDELLAALKYLTTRSTVKGRIDKTRLGVMGHSMGGGGSLEASSKQPSLKASIPLAPWDRTVTWSNDHVPTLIVTGQADTNAPPDTMGKSFYTSLPATPGKAYLELKGADHLAPTRPNTVIAKFSISWLKRFIDNDTRYDRFLCPPPKSDNNISDYQATCPYPIAPR
jgi:dienelactone hydrolase